MKFLENKTIEQLIEALKIPQKVLDLKTDWFELKIENEELIVYL